MCIALNKIKMLLLPCQVQKFIKLLDCRSFMIVTENGKGLLLTNKAGAHFY